LILCAIYNDASPEEKTDFMKKIRCNQSRIKSLMDVYPGNTNHKYYLVEAEIARLLDDDLKALELYHQSIKYAVEEQFIHIAALANELLGKSLF
jgi:hypothetical protein